MIHIDQISPIASILLTAAKSRMTVPYSKLFTVFSDPNISNNDVFDTLEAAARALAFPSQAIYSAVLAKKAIGVPGSGFFDIFRNCHIEEYQAIAGDTIIQDLSEEEMCAITVIERARVYEHAERHF